MNKIVKIALLCLAVLISFGAVIVFAKTQLDPPAGELSIEQVKEECRNALKKDLARAESSNDILVIDSAYHVIATAAQFMLADSLLKAADHDELLTKVIDKYIPKFVDQSNGKFAQHTWYEPDLNFMRSRCVELNGVKKADGSQLLSADSRRKLSEITNVLDLYNRARAAASVGTGFTSLADARAKINNARQFTTMQPICNNTDLVSLLNGLPARLEQSHYSSLSAQVERLRSCHNFRSEADFDAYAETVQSRINEYANNAQSVYGYKSDVGSLSASVRQYYDNADCWDY